MIYAVRSSSGWSRNFTTIYGKTIYFGWMRWPKEPMILGYKFSNGQKHEINVDITNKDIKGYMIILDGYPYCTETYIIKNNIKTIQNWYIKGHAGDLWKGTPGECWLFNRYMPAQPVNNNTIDNGLPSDYDISRQEGYIPDRHEHMHLMKIGEELPLSSIWRCVNIFDIYTSESIYALPSEDMERRLTDKPIPKCYWIDLQQDEGTKIVEQLKVSDGTIAPAKPGIYCFIAEVKNNGITAYYAAAIHVATVVPTPIIDPTPVVSPMPTRTPIITYKFADTSRFIAEVNSQKLIPAEYWAYSHNDGLFADGLYLNEKALADVLPINKLNANGLIKLTIGKKPNENVSAKYEYYYTDLYRLYSRGSGIQSIRIPRD